MKDIVIIGAGGLAKEIAFLLEVINKHEHKWNILGYISDDIGHSNGKYKTIADDEWLCGYNKEIYVIFGLGSPTIIQKLFALYKKNGNIIFPNIIHPNATGDWERIKMGEGNIISSNNSFTTDIKIGSCNLFNLNCTLGHDSEIGSFNVINPIVNISGNVKIESSILIGTGSQILQNISIGSNSIIGAGAVVTKNIDEPGVYVGIPAKRIK